MQAFLTLLIEIIIISFIAISMIDIALAKLNVVIAALPQPRNTVIAPREWAVAFEPIEALPTFATIDWIQSVAEEPVEPVDVVAIAKHRLVSTAKHYKLRGEDVIHVDHIPFQLPPIKTYQLRSRPVVKVIHLLAAL